MNYAQYINFVDIPGYEGHYKIDDCGSVISEKNGYEPKWREPQYDINRNVWSIALYKNGKRKKWYIAELVLMTFVGPRPQGCYIEYLHPDKLHDLDNIRWSQVRTSSRNHAKITANTAREIRSGRETGMPYSKLASEYGISYSTVRRICRGDIWKDADTAEEAHDA